MLPLRNQSEPQTGLFSNRRTIIQGSGELKFALEISTSAPEAWTGWPEPSGSWSSLLRSKSHGAPAPKHTTSPHIAKHCGHAFIPLHNLRSQPWVPSLPGISHISALTHPSIKAPSPPAGSNALPWTHTDFAQLSTAALAVMTGPAY